MAARKVAAFIVNYNMPERTDALAVHILDRVQWPVDLFVIDNGSDLCPPSKFSKVKLPQNVQTTGGWLAGVDAARESNNNYLAYWFIITSAEFVDGKDPLTPMALALCNYPEVVGIHPALTEDSTTAWTHLKNRGTAGVRRTWMIDNICSLWRADWWEEQGGFDPELKYAWGIDFEMCHKARAQERLLWVHEGVKVRKVTDIGYSMDRMNMSADDRVGLASANMADVLSRKYGPAWNWKMLNENVAEEMR
jgi:hypothetical protein